MALILIPVFLSTFLGPGVGQLYNREFKKGIILIVVSFGLITAFSVWLTRAALVYLPADISAVDHAFLRDIIQNHIIKEYPGTFYTYEILLGLIWLYGFMDAYLGGVRRRNAVQGEPSSRQS